MRRRDMLVATAGALAATILAGGVALAEQPADAEVIQGCYQKNRGSLRVIDPAIDSCQLASEVPISWNATGPTGPQGIQGPPGPRGEKGETGAAGATGATGGKGDTGAPGPPGAPGTPGAKGDKGDAGAIGPQGPAGTAGISGYEVITEASDTSLDAFQGFTRQAVCPAGKNALGGGFYVNDVSVAASFPGTVSHLGSAVGPPDRWWVQGAAGPLGGTVYAFVVCANVS